MNTGERPFSKLVDWILPPSIVAYALWGLYMSVFHIGFGWIGCHQESPVYSMVYIIFSTVAISSIIGLIIFLWTLPPDHDVPPRTEPAFAQEWFDQYPRECFETDGALSVCKRGQCEGRIKPPRTHHCSVCQRCRMEWDHHCPWVGSCLTVHQSKAFLMLLIATSFSTYFMAAPVIDPILGGAYTMYTISRSHPGCNHLWWDWWGSYVMFGGPGGRWVLGTALGYWVSEPQPPLNPHQCRYGLPFMRPTSSAALTLIIALSLGGFCSVLAAQMMFRLLRGQTTIEALQTGTSRRDRVSSRFLWLPSMTAHVSIKDQPRRVTSLKIGGRVEEARNRPLARHDSSQRCGSVVSIDPKTRIYDLGIWENAKTYWRRPMFALKASVQTLSKPPPINRDIIGRLNKTST